MKNYVFAGASSRALNMYAKPMLDQFKEYAHIEGVYDINPGRAKVFAQECGGLKVYDDFDEMLKETKPDKVIVTTVDAFHHEYIIKALEAGCDVITEKPMTIDADKCKEILEAEKRTGKKIIVTFNYRFNPYMTEIKKIIKAGTIGDVLSVDFEWLLDRNMSYGAHGTSYFRRWNSYMNKSGGLLVHKSTHHFDLVNWWIDQEPVEVFAYGALRTYGKNGNQRGERCLTCEHKNTCEFFYDITKNEFEMKLYVENEEFDGYQKDSCVFNKAIDIYDTMSVNVKYSKGAFLTYSLIAHAAYEGWRISINGTKGRLEADVPETGILSLPKTLFIKVFDLEGHITTHEIAKDFTGHGGGDNRLLETLFMDNISDPLGHQAGSEAGALSILIGACANVSIKEKRPVGIREKVKEI